MSTHPERSGRRLGLGPTLGLFALVSIVGVGGTLVSGIYPKTPIGLLLLCFVIGPVVGTLYIVAGGTEARRESTRLGRWLDQDPSWAAPRRVAVGVVLGIVVVVVWYWLWNVAWYALPDTVRAFATRHLGSWWLHLRS